LKAASSQSLSSIESLKQKELTGANLYNANLSLKILLTILLLKEIAVEEEKLQGFYRKIQLLQGYGWKMWNTM
jgi:hypothetical protein